MRIGRGDVLPRSVYHPVIHSAMLAELSELGFSVSGPNSQPALPIIFTMKSGNGCDERTDIQGGDGFTGHWVHTVMLYPNGEWEHISEGSHDGIGLSGLYRAIGRA